jgi:predicted ATPase
LAWATVLRGWALAEQGQGEEGINQMRHGLAASLAVGAEGLRPYFLAMLAEACGKEKQAEKGLTVLTEALDLAEKNDEHMWEAELYRLKGQLTLLKDPQSEAEAYFRKAIEIARFQGTKSLELRAAISLSRLWQQQGKKKEAHQILSEIYGWFTEGFDTEDLKEAKALLENLDCSRPW